MISHNARLEAWYPPSNKQYIICISVHGPYSVAYVVYTKGAEDGTEVLAEISEMLIDGWISQEDVVELNKITIALQGLYR